MEQFAAKLRDTLSKVSKEQRDLFIQTSIDDIMLTEEFSAYSANERADIAKTLKDDFNELSQEHQDFILTNGFFATHKAAYTVDLPLTP